MRREGSVNEIAWHATKDNKNNKLIGHSSFKKRLPETAFIIFSFRAPS